MSQYLTLHYTEMRAIFDADQVLQSLDISILQLFQSTMISQRENIISAKRIIV